MINVTQEDDNRFTIEWDENDPQEKIFNNWTEEDFINAIQDYLHALEKSGEVDINQVTRAVNQINDHIEEEIIAVCEETFGKECYEGAIYEDYYDWYTVKEEAIREYQNDELSQTGDVPPPEHFPHFP